MTSGSEERQHWRKCMLSADATVGAAIRNLDQSALQIVLAVTNEGSLVGTVTDGDIRRALLRGLTMDSSIESIIYRDPLVVPPKLDRNVALQIMRANRIHQLPVVDSERRVVGLHLLDELIMPGRRSNLIVFMAGGQGSRLRPLTDSCPKPLLPVGGKPMLQHSIEQAKADGFYRITITLHYLGHMIENHFGDGTRAGVEIDYLHEDAPLGTAGALGLLEPKPHEPFIVANGDVLTDIGYAELLDFHCRHQAVATMAVRLHEWQHPFGVVRTNGVDIVDFEEKPVARTHINAGIYVLEPNALEMLDVGKHCDMPSLFDALKLAGERTIVYPMHEPWLDVGRERDLEKARASAADVVDSDD